MNVEINDIAIDSRRVTAGTLFIAVPGTQTGGHQFIPKAIEQGASAIVVQSDKYEVEKDKYPQVTFITVVDSESAVGPLAHHFFGDPTGKLNLVGVTGTNGKTTTVHMIKTILEDAGKKVLVGGNGGGGFSGYYDLILEANDGNYDVLLVEVCDMTLDFCRYCFDFDMIGLTNIGNDHMDVHKTIANYKNSLVRFFDGKLIFTEMQGLFNMSVVKTIFSTNGMKLLDNHMQKKKKKPSV